MARRQKPATAAWIQRERKRLGLSTKQLSERLALIGAKVSEQTISVWESYAGRKPSADNIDALERLFGSTGPLETTESGDDLAAAIRGLTDELRAWRAEDRARLGELEAVVTQLVRERLNVGVGEGSPEPAAPRA